MKLTASVKRIIWAIGWYLVWVIDDHLLFSRTGEIGSNVYQWAMLLIWIIPLVLFKDDKGNRK